MPSHRAFEGVKGYATYERAVRRGVEVTENSEAECRWVVIALPNGRFAPCIIANNSVWITEFLHLTNVCVVN